MESQYPLVTLVGNGIITNTVLFVGKRLSHCSGSVVGSNTVCRNHRSSGGANLGWFLTLTPQEAGGTSKATSGILRQLTWNRASPGEGWPTCLESRQSGVGLHDNYTQCPVSLNSEQGMCSPDGRR